MAHALCKLDKQGYTSARTGTLARTTAPTNTHTHKYVLLIAFPPQKRKYLNVTSYRIACFGNSNTRRSWVVASCPVRYICLKKKKATHYPLNRGLWVPVPDSTHHRTDKSLTPDRNQTRFLSRPACSLVTTPTELPWFRRCETLNKIPATPVNLLHLVPVTYRAHAAAWRCFP